MTNEDVNRAIETPKRGEKEEEETEKMDKNSELELLSNLSSSTEIEQETKEHNLRRSKRLTKTNPIVRRNNPVPSDYRNYSQKTKQPGNNTRHQLNTANEQACPERHFDDRTTITDAAGNTAATQRFGWTTASKEKNTPPLANSHPIVERGMKNKKHRGQTFLRLYCIYIIRLKYLPTVYHAMLLFLPSTN